MSIMNEGGDEQMKAEEQAKADRKAAEAYDPKWDTAERDEYNCPLATGKAEEDAELEELRTICYRERHHGQWKKQGINLFCLAVLTTAQLLRNTVFNKCSVGDWLVTAALFVIMLLVVIYSVMNIQNDQRLKIKYGHINLVDSDLRFSGKDLRTVLGLGFGGGWVAGALGLGGGVIFNPLLIALGVPPKVSSATGMYLITFSKIATCIIYFLDDLLIFDYGLWIAGWSTLGAICGLIGANIYMEKVGRQSIIVFCLALVMGISAIGVPVFGGRDLMAESAQGKDIWAFKSICKKK